MNSQMKGGARAPNPADEAAAWVARMMSGEASDEERAAFAVWREASTENRVALEQLDAALAQADAVSVEALEEQFTDELATAAEEAARPVWPIAASLAAIAAAAALAVTFFSPSVQPESTLYATSRGEIETAALPDGSSIALNSATTLSVAYERKRRRARLTAGEAAFEIVRDPDRPFVVETPHGEVVVTGTVFNVEIGDEASYVYVVSGSVGVPGFAGGEARLAAGETTSIDALGRSPRVDAFDPATVLAWRDGLARFRAAPLREVIAELNAYFDTPIALGEPALASLSVTGDFDIADQSAAVAALALVFDLEAEYAGDKIVLKRVAQ